MMEEQCCELVQPLPVTPEILPVCLRSLICLPRFSHGIKPGFTSGKNTGELYAPYGLTELTAGHLVLNPLNCTPQLFLPKAKEDRVRWPWLTTHAPGQDQPCTRLR